MVAMDPLENLHSLFGAAFRLTLVLQVGGDNGDGTGGRFGDGEFDQQGHATTTANLAANSFHEG